MARPLLALVIMRRTLISGLERFFADSWALRIGAGYHYHLHASGSALQALGANWAIAAYF